jgi:hypothetical protein
VGKKVLSTRYEGLREKPRSPRPCALNKQQLNQLGDYIRKNSIKESGGSLKAQMLVAYIA